MQCPAPCRAHTEPRHEPAATLVFLPASGNCGLLHSQEGVRLVRDEVFASPRGVQAHILWRVIKSFIFSLTNGTTFYFSFIFIILF